MIRDVSWMDHASCAGLGAAEAFFPDRGDPALIVRKVCAACPVRTECGEYAAAELDYAAPGIWGGKTHLDRRKERAGRAASSDTTLKEMTP